MERFGWRLARTLPRALRNALALSLSLALTGAPACSRESAPPASPPPAPAAEALPPSEESAAAEPAADEVRVASDDVKALVSPIALYPDPLLELVLQASAQPGQVVLASRFLDDYAKDPSRQPDPAWDTAIIGLLNTPDVIQMMNESLDWTTELGQAVSADLDGVQLAVQELRWSAFNMGALESNDHQEVVATGGVIAIVPKEREQVAVPQYDGAALLASSEAAPPAQGTGGLAPAQPSAGEAYGTAPAAGYGYAAVPVSYAAPQPSFWSSAAVFAGGAALGGLLGYAIGSNDDDDDDWNGYHGGWGWDDDWDNRPWRGGGYSGGHNDINISGNTIIRPARPGTGIRPNRPITRPGGGYGKPGRPGGAGRPGLARPVVGDGGSLGRPGGVGTDRPGRPGSGVGAQRPGGRPGGSQVGRPANRPGAGGSGRGDAAQPGRPRPPGVAPARPSGRPDLSTREVKMPRPDRAQQAAARPGGGAQRPAARPAQTRQPDRGGALARNESRPRVERERARGQQSRTAAKPSRDRAKVQNKSRGGNRSAMAKRGGGGGGGGHKKAANRGKQSRKR